MPMRYRRMPIEIESPEERGYGTILNNLTESSVTDRTLESYGIEIGDLVQAYGDHRGLPELREPIAASAPGCRPDDVLCTPGAAAALFFVASALLDPGDHAVIEHTNYATNLETPRMLGADVSTIELTIENGFAVDIDHVASLVTDRTKLISVTTPHNPTGTTLSLEQLQSLVELAESRGVHLLVDETYREMTGASFEDPAEPLPVAASLSPKAISVSSVSKSFGLPGLRQGWLICRDPELSETLLAAKEQIVICGSAFDEAATAAVLANADTHLATIRADIAQRLATVTEWMSGQADWLEWVQPSGGVVCFPRVRSDVIADIDEFYRVLNEDHGTYVGEGHWFAASRHHFRVGFGWPTPDELDRGLAALAATAAALR